MSDEKEIGHRVRKIREALGLSQKDAAAKIGISLRSWQAMERGENVPSGESLLKFQSIGFNAGWVLSGLGPETIDQTKTPDRTHIEPSRIHGDVLENLLVLVASEHEKASIHLRQRDALRESVRLYNELAMIVSNLDDAEEVDAAFPILAIRLKKRISEAVAKPGSGKRSA